MGTTRAATSDHLYGQCVMRGERNTWRNHVSGWWLGHRKLNSHTEAPPQRRPAHPRVPDGGRGRTAAQGHQEQPLGTPGRHHDPCGAYRHGLRASELVDLRWDQIDFATATLHVRRVKQGSPSTHPIIGDELRMLRRLQREQEPKSPFVFTSERGSPFTTAGFARMVARAGAEARLGFKAHPHMLRHACGFALAAKGHDTRALQAYLGHKNIQYTVRYTELSPTRFKTFWRV